MVLRKEDVQGMLRWLALLGPEFQPTGVNIATPTYEGDDALAVDLELEAAGIVDVESAVLLGEELSTDRAMKVCVVLAYLFGLFAGRLRGGDRINALGLFFLALGTPEVLHIKEKVERGECFFGECKGAKLPDRAACAEHQEYEDLLKIHLTMSEQSAREASGLRPRRRV